MAEIESPPPRHTHAYPIHRQVLFHLPLLLLLAWCFCAFECEAELLRTMAQYRKTYPRLSKILMLVSHFGSIAVYLLYLGVGVSAICNRDRKGIGLILGVLVSLLLSLLMVRFLKYAVSRPRPPALWLDITPFTSPRSSFPSSHLSESLVVTSPLALRFDAIMLPIIIGVIPAIMGFSRLFLGRHHPSDLCGSIVVGCICSWVAWHVAGKITAEGQYRVRYSEKIGHNKRSDVLGELS